MKKNFTLRWCSFVHFVHFFSPSFDRLSSSSSSSSSSSFAATDIFFSATFFTNCRHTTVEVFKYRTGRIINSSWTPMFQNCKCILCPTSQIPSLMKNIILLYSRRNKMDRGLYFIIRERSLGIFRRQILNNLYLIDFVNFVKFNIFSQLPGI